MSEETLAFVSNINWATLGSPTWRSSWIALSVSVARRLPLPKNPSRLMGCKEKKIAVEMLIMMAVCRAAPCRPADEYKVETCSRMLSCILGGWKGSSIANKRMEASITPVPRGAVDVDSRLVYNCDASCSSDEQVGERS